MSLANKLEGLKAELESKKTVEDLNEGKESFGAIIARERALVQRLNELQQAFSGLKGSYSQAESDLSSFKGVKGKINELYGQYEEVLQARGIDSAAAMLKDPELAKEPEAKEYFAKSPSKEKEAMEYPSSEAAQKAESKRGRLAEGVETVSKAKKKVKGIMPEAELKFTGRKKEGSDQSPRQESFGKIEDEISSLEAELELIKKQKEEAKKEYLPKIEKLVSDELDKALPEGGSYSLAPQAANIRLIPDQVFAVCGDFWPEAREAAQVAIEKGLSNRKINMNRGDISNSLEAEKLIYDVGRIKEQYGEVLRLDYDKRALSHLDNSIRDRHCFSFQPQPGRITFRSGQVMSAAFLEEADRLNKKNPEAKKEIEIVKEKLLAGLKQEAEGIQSGLLDRRSIRNEKAEAKKIIADSIKKLESFSAPDDFFKNSYWDTTNKLANTKPRFMVIDDWSKKMINSLEKLYSDQIETLSNLARSESEPMNKLSNDIYNSRHYGSGAESRKVGGFEIPAASIEALYHGYQISDMERFKAFFTSLEGKTMTEEEFKQVLQETLDEYQREINSVPGAEQAIMAYQNMYRDDKRYTRNFVELLDAKMNIGSRSWRPQETVDIGGVKSKLFDLNRK